MKSYPLCSRSAAVVAALLAATTSAFATDYTWTTTGTSGHDWTGGNAKWSPAGTPSSDQDNAAFSSLTASTRVNLNGSFAINNLSAAGSGGTTLTLIASGAARTFDISGALTKSANSNTVLFQGDGLATLDMSIGSLSLSTGTFRLGNTSSDSALGNLDIGGVTVSTSSGSATIDLNVANDYSLGLVTFSGGGTSTRTINLINSGGTGYSRVATVSGLVQTQGTVGVIAASKTAASSGTHAATLAIEVAAATVHTATTQLIDGVGGKLALRKTGEGRQELSGAHTFTGGTTVEDGTLLVSGSLAAEGELTVASGATFVAANSLAVGDVNLESGAILGFSLDAVASSLAIGGDLALTGAGPATFTIDFGNTGAFGQAYDGLLSIVGTNAFAGSNLSYINFGSAGQSGVLSFDQMVNGFTVTAIPEPASGMLVSGVAALMIAGFGRRRNRQS